MVKKIKQVDPYDEETKIIAYRCPLCHRLAADMTIIESKYSPDQVDAIKAELLKEYDLSTLSGEILACPCGISLSWYDLEKVVEE